MSSSSSSSILITLLLILSVTILCLLLRLLNSHFFRRLSPSTAAAATAATSTTTADTALTSSSSSNHHSGLHRVSPETPESLVLDDLPLFTFGTVNRRSSSGGDCAICLSKFEQHHLLRLLPMCCHAFHASCIDTWLDSNQTCPLCRSPIHPSESDIFKALSVSNDGGALGRAGSFRLAIGSVSRSHPDSAAESRTSYSLGSLDYVVEEDSEVPMGQTHRIGVSDKGIGTPVAQPVREQSLATEVAGERSWLKEYVDRISTSLSYSEHSFRSSGRFFAGSSRGSELGIAGDYDLEANRVGEEISELFRWVSGV